MAISQSVDMDSPIKKILLDDLFWERVVSSVKLLKPIAVAIAQIEGDNAILSDVQTLLADVRKEIRTALPTSLLLQAEETAVLKYIKKRGLLPEAQTRRSVHVGALVSWQEHPGGCRDQQGLWYHHYRVSPPWPG